MPRVASLPWRDRDDGLDFHHVDGSVRAVLNRSGLAMGERSWPWSDIWDFDVTLPTSSRRGHRANAILAAVAPESYDYSPLEETLTLDVARWPTEVTLGRHRRYSWQEAFVLAEFTDFLRRRELLRALATPGLLTNIMRRVPGTVPRRARPWVRSDLLGLDRKLGGHGAYDETFARLVGDRG